MAGSQYDGLGERWEKCLQQLRSNGSFSREAEAQDVPHNVAIRGGRNLHRGVLRLQGGAEYTLQFQARRQSEEKQVPMNMKGLAKNPCTNAGVYPGIKELASTLPEGGNKRGPAANGG